jgi:hypothetical protein
MFLTAKCTILKSHKGKFMFLAAVKMQKRCHFFSFQPIRRVEFSFSETRNVLQRKDCGVKSRNEAKKKLFKMINQSIMNLLSIVTIFEESGNFVDLSFRRPLKRIPNILIQTQPSILELHCSYPITPNWDYIPCNLAFSSLKMCKFTKWCVDKTASW